MEKRIEVKTLIKNDPKLVNTEYVAGRISGIGHVVGGCKRGYANMQVKEGYVYRHAFTLKEYVRFMMIVEALYPGVCKFNYQMKESE